MQKIINHYALMGFLTEDYLLYVIFYDGVLKGVCWGGPQECRTYRPSMLHAGRWRISDVFVGQKQCLGCLLVLFIKG